MTTSATTSAAHGRRTTGQKLYTVRRSVQISSAPVSTAAMHASCLRQARPCERKATHRAEDSRCLPGNLTIIRQSPHKASTVVPARHGKSCMPPDCKSPHARLLPAMQCCSKYSTQLCKCSENSSSTDCRFDRRLARSGRQSPDARSHKLLPADQHNLRQPDCTKASERPLTLAAAAQTAPSQQCCCS